VKVDVDGHCCDVPGIDATVMDPTALREVASDGVKFLGQKLVGAGKGVINFGPGVYNAIISAFNDAPAAQDQMSLVPTVPLNSIGEHVGSMVITLGLSAYLGQGKGRAMSAAGDSEAATGTRAATEPHPSVSTPYERPTGATTAEQRGSVQGKPCVDCGKVESKMVANHKTPLVKEYYQTGNIDWGNMRSTGAVNSHCPTCSARSGGHLSHYSKQMKAKLKDRQN
jgi:hypothetical protein